MKIAAYIALFIIFLLGLASIYLAINGFLRKTHLSERKKEVASYQEVINALLTVKDTKFTPLKEQLSSDFQFSDSITNYLDGSYAVDIQWKERRKSKRYYNYNCRSLVLVFNDENRLISVSIKEPKNENPPPKK